MSVGSPFGFGPLPQVSPEDLAALLRRAPLGPAQSFTGTSGAGPAVAMDEAQTQQLERGMGMVPDVTSAPAPQTVPMPPRRPFGFGALPLPGQGDAAADVPATGAVPAAGQMPSAAAPASAPQPGPALAEPSLGDRIGSGLDKFQKNGGFDMLGSIGMGLLSSPTWGGGLAAGMKNYQDSSATRAASNLAQAEYGLKVRKLAQEEQGQNATAAFIKSKIPGIPDAQALALAGNGSFVTELSKGILPPQELYRQYTDTEGNRWNRNERTGQETIALKADEDKTVAPVSEEDRVRLGLPAGSYQKDANGKISPINPTGTTINMGGEKAYDAEVGKTYAKQFTDIQTAGRNATNKMNSLALIEQQMTAPGFYSGYGGEQVKRFNQLLGAIGIKDAKTASPAEVVDALSNQVVLDQLGGSLGAGISDRDRKSIALIGPGIAKTPEGNRQLIGIYRSIAQREQQIAQMARDYAKANGGRIDAGFDDQVARFANENPLFPAAQGGATAKSDGVAGPTGAGNVAAPRTQADFDALPKGAMYIDPADGRRYRKN